jgi:hypothetical protein
LATRGDWETDDLGALLRLLPDEASDRLAALLVDMPGSDVAGRRHLPRAMNRQGLVGRQLIPDILDDLSFLGSHETGSRHPYRQLLHAVAMRHGSADDCKQPASVAERQIQARYQAGLRPIAVDFKDLGSSEWYRKVAFGVPAVGWLAYMMSPDWRTVTAVVLEVAALRRIALMREFTASLEA